MVSIKSTAKISFQARFVIIRDFGFVRAEHLLVVGVCTPIDDREPAEMTVLAPVFKGLDEGSEMHRKYEARLRDALLKLSNGTMRSRIGMKREIEIFLSSRISKKTTLTSMQTGS